MKQLKLFNLEDKTNSTPKTFGGTNFKGQRKTRRPLETNKPIHLILKTANKEIFFSPKNQELHELIKKSARRFNVRIFRYSISLSHFHFLTMFDSRAQYRNFVRYFSAQIGLHLNKIGVFTQRPYTRIANWGHDFQNLLNYVKLNIAESFQYGGELANLNLSEWEC